MVFLTISTRGGRPARNISNSPGTASVIPKVIRLPGAQIVLVTWIEQTPAQSTIWFAKSLDNGVTWSTPTQETNSGQILSGNWENDFNCYSIDYDDSVLHMVYQLRQNENDDFEIVYARSTDLAQSWHIVRTITTNATDSIYPDVAARGEYVHITYQDSWPGNPDIMYKRINDYGMGSTDLSRRLTSSAGDSLYPRIAVSADGTILNVAYEEDVPNKNHQIFLTTIRDNGSGTFFCQQLTWGTDWNGLPDIEPSTGAETEYFYIVYNTLQHGNREIMYKRLDNWCIPPYNTYTVRLTYSDTESYCTSIAFDGTYNNIHITYHDNLPGNNEVYYRKFLDYGGGGYTGTRICWTSGDSINATVASSGAWPHIVWSDSTSGNYEIYWKYGY